MTLQDCTKLLAPLAISLGAELDEPDFRAYHRALEDVPVTLLAAACERAARVPRSRFEPRFPAAPRLREWAEEARLAASKAKAFSWVPCEACEANHGWVPSPVGEGRLTRCACWLAHQDRIKSGGIATPLALPVDEEVEA